MLTMTEDERLEWQVNAVPVHVDIDGEVIKLFPKEFSSGSLGWHGNAKLHVQSHRVQLNFIMTIVGSKLGDATPVPPGAKSKNVQSYTNAPASPSEVPTPLFDDKPTPDAPKPVQTRQKATQKPRKGK